MGCYNHGNMDPMVRTDLQWSAYLNKSWYFFIIMNHLPAFGALACFPYWNTWKTCSVWESLTSIWYVCISALSLLYWCWRGPFYSARNVQINTWSFRILISIYFFLFVFSLDLSSRIFPIELNYLILHLRTRCFVVMYFMKHGQLMFYSTVHTPCS